MSYPCLYSVVAMFMDKEVAMSKDKEVSKSKGKQVKKYVTFDALMDKEMLDLMFEQVLLGRKGTVVSKLKHMRVLLLQ